MVNFKVAQLGEKKPDPPKPKEYQLIAEELVGEFQENMSEKVSIMELGGDETSGQPLSVPDPILDKDVMYYTILYNCSR
jgi:hypothetical protein